MVRTFTGRRLAPHLPLHIIMVVDMVSGFVWLRSAASQALHLSIYTNIFFGLFLLAFLISSEVMLISSVSGGMWSVRALEGGTGPEQSQGTWRDQ